MPDDRPTKVVSEMTRHVLIREGNKLDSVVAEAELPTEAELHDALTRYPEFIPPANPVGCPASDRVSQR